MPCASASSGSSSMRALGRGLRAREAVVRRDRSRSTPCSRWCRRARHTPARRPGRVRSRARNARARGGSHPASRCSRSSGRAGIPDTPRDRRSAACAASSSARRSASGAALRRSARRSPAGRSAARCSLLPELLAPELRLGRRVDELRLDVQDVALLHDAPGQDRPRVQRQADGRRIRLQPLVAEHQAARHDAQAARAATGC